MTTKQLIDGRYELSFLCFFAALLWAGVMLVASHVVVAQAQASADHNELRSPLPPSVISAR